MFSYTYYDMAQAHTHRKRMKSECCVTVLRSNQIKNMHVCSEGGAAGGRHLPSQRANTYIMRYHRRVGAAIKECLTHTQMTTVRSQPQRCTTVLVLRVQVHLYGVNVMGNARGLVPH